MFAGGFVDAMLCAFQLGKFGFHGSKLLHADIVVVAVFAGEADVVVQQFFKLFQVLGVDLDLALVNAQSAARLGEQGAGLVAKVGRPLEARVKFCQTPQARGDLTQRITSSRVA